jgi:hypothetical protein
MENGNAPATKQDVELLRTETKQDIELLRTEVKREIAEVKGEIAGLKENLEMHRSETQHGFNDVKEAMRDIQTELLKAFYSYGQTTDLKLKDGETSDAMARQRLTVVESRITDIERRLNMPPRQAS